MAELVKCPRCGCGVQVADTFLGRRVRCFGCQHSFVASPGGAPPPAPPPRERPPAADDEPSIPDRGPFCPGCGRRIGWRDLSCPHCGEELELEDGRRPLRGIDDIVRRDCEPHRGSLLVSLGNVSMIVGGLSLCMFGAGALVSIPLGLLVVLMASRDLELMRQGRMDLRGKSQTEAGRTGGIAGILLGFIFAAFYAFIFLVK